MNYMTLEVGKKADELVAACIMNSENEMQRELSGAHEAWARIKELTESAAKLEKDTEKLMKELWEAVKAGNDDEYITEFKQVAMNAETIAATWATAAAFGQRAEREV